MTSLIQRLFTEARTFSEWEDKPIEEGLLEEIYGLAKYPPTSANSCPLRIVFVRSEEGKEKLRPFLAPGNEDKTMSAPVTAIFAQDMEFYEQLPVLFPQTDARSWFVGKEEAITATAFRNSTLQAAYFMLAARAKGLDCGPMSGFDAEGLDKAFFPDGVWKSNFLCNLGYGDKESLYPRNPRLDFEEVCQFV